MTQILNTQTPQSSNIASVSYDTLMSNLIVEFKNGSKYEFVNVPQSVYDECSKAESVGRYFQANIKGKYDFLKL